MDKGSENYFTTGEFANLCGVNKRTLFHYHDIGLLCPAYVDENGYRYYSYRQLDVFLIISILKELNVPLREIKKYLDGRTPERLINLSNQKIAEIDKEIERLNTVKHLLKETIILTNKGIEADCDKIILEEQEEKCIIRSALLSEENSKDYIKWIIEYTKFMNSIESEDNSFAGAMLSKENIANRKCNSYSYLFSKTGKKKTDPSVSVKPKGVYAVAYHHGSYETRYKTYDKLLKFLKKKHLSMGEFAYEEYLLDEIAVKKSTDYITQITVPVEESN